MSVLEVLEQRKVQKPQSDRPAGWGISRRMLTMTVRHIEVDGFVTRRVYPHIPPKVKYGSRIWARSLCERLLRRVALARGASGRIQG